MAEATNLPKAQPPTRSAAPHPERQPGHAGPCSDARKPARPVGEVEPGDPRLRQALSAARQGRMADAQRHVGKVDSDDDEQSAWQLLVRGLIEFHHARTREAESLLLQAAVHAFVAAHRHAASAAAPSTGWPIVPHPSRGLPEVQEIRGNALILEDWCGTVGESNPDDPAHMRRPDEQSAAAAPVHVLRMAALALHHAGRVQRRRDRCAQAAQTHRAAWTLRQAHGSCEELWATAIELGLDAHVAQDVDRAEHWFRRAAELAQHCPPDAVRMHATALGHLAETLAGSQRYEEAVQAARTASQLLRANDPAAAETALAQARLGTVLVAFSALRHERGMEADRTLREALPILESACSELMAFGSGHTAAAENCRRQADFARRLLDSIRDTAS